jgi:hypothetical protein
MRIAAAMGVALVLGAGLASSGAEETLPATTQAATTLAEDKVVIAHWDHGGRPWRPPGIMLRRWPNSGLYDLRVDLAVSESGRKRLAAVQEKVAEMGYRVDMKQCVVWAIPGDKDERAKARELAKAAAKELEKKIKAAFAGARTGGMDVHDTVATFYYNLPGSKATGIIRFGVTTTIGQRWLGDPGDGAMRPKEPDLQVMLLRLGLAVAADYYRYSVNDPSARRQIVDADGERKQLNDLVREAAAPLVKMEEGAGMAVSCGGAEGDSAGEAGGRSGEQNCDGSI